MIPMPVTNGSTFSAMWFKSSGAVSTHMSTFSSTVPPNLRYLPQGALGSGWKIVSAIVLNVENDDDGEFVVTDFFSTVYGNGKTERYAINDYYLSLIDYYEILENQPRTPAIASALKRIRSYVDRIGHAKAT